MHRLRSSKLIASLVLAWFGLFLGAAMASSLIHPSSIQVICVAGGAMKMVEIDGDGGKLNATAKMNCPLCAASLVFPSRLDAFFNKAFELEHVLYPIAAVHIASLTAPPLPSRGPPNAY